MTPYEKLERLHNGPTRYELIAERGETRILIAYCMRTGRHSILEACRKHGQALIDFMGMSKRDTERLLDQIRRMAERLTEGDDAKATSQLAGDLRQSGIDPDVLKQRFHEAAKAIAARERAAGRPAPLALQQAIEQTAPTDPEAKEVTKC